MVSKTDAIPINAMQEAFSTTALFSVVAATVVVAAAVVVAERKHGLK